MRKLGRFSAEGFDDSQPAVPFGTLLEEDGESNASDIFLSKG